MSSRHSASGAASITLAIFSRSMNTERAVFTCDPAFNSAKGLPFARPRRIAHLNICRAYSTVRLIVAAAYPAEVRLARHASASTSPIVATSRASVKWSTSADSACFIRTRDAGFTATPSKNAVNSPPSVTT
ncbi:MAG: hypothetical protein ACKVS8_14790 [Phycisphaerales bacterium]